MIEELAALVLPWAKEHHPEKYAATVQLVTKPASFEKCLVRLVEIRWEQDPEWRRTVPVFVLEETAIVARFRHRATGQVIEVRGRRAAGPRVWGWDELALTPEQFRERLEVKQTLDLVREA